MPSLPCKVPGKPCLPVMTSRVQRQLVIFFCAAIYLYSMCPVVYSVPLYTTAVSHQLDMVHFHTKTYKSPILPILMSRKTIS